MKRVALVLAIGALLTAFVTLASPAYAVPVFEDPQVCLNGNLLMVEPTTAPIEVWVSAGRQVDVDLNITNCGGNPNLPALEADHVFNVGVGKWVTIAVETKKHTDVLFHWNGETITKNSGNNKWIVLVKKAN